MNAVTSGVILGFPCGRRVVETLDDFFYAVVPGDYRWLKHEVYVYRATVVKVLPCEEVWSLSPYEDELVSIVAEGHAELEKRAF